MRYNVAQLLRGPTGSRRQFDLSEEIGDLDPDLEPLRPLVGSIELLRTSQGILVTGKLGTRIRTACRRCLQSADVDVELDLEEEFYPIVQIGDAPIEEIPDEDYDEALLINEFHTLDLHEVVRQGLWLAVPMEALCRLDCAGLCPKCGGNRNLGECSCRETDIDPRWAALQALLAEEQESQERSD
ncbi:MAG: DUF177 domain-containing protein [Anaerolineae bacterium]|jgi:uncharacterized protein